MSPPKSRASVKLRPKAPMAESEASGATITRVIIEALFGLYNYDIPGENGLLGRTSLLYGENGLGKTNILRILFHLLSPAGDAGHRTALGRTKFRKVEVRLSNSIVVRAVREGGALEGALRLEVARDSDSPDAVIGAWNWFPKDPTLRESQRWLANLDPATAQRMAEAPSTLATRQKLQSVFVQFLAQETDPRVGESAFLDALRKHVPPVYFLTSDRILSSDQLDRDRYAATAPDYRRMRPEEMLAKGREHALAQAVGLASRTLTRLGIRAARKGSGSTHTIYRDLIKRLASRRTKKAPRTAQALDEMTTRLLALSSKYSLYSQYGLAPVLDGQSLVSQLSNVRTTERSVAIEVLRPYVESLTEQARDLDEAYRIINTFVSTVNGFLYDKTLSFSVGEGMVVRNRLGEDLRPEDLSSGEQQLLLLFCHISLAHAAGGIFIIDEPEISLNIKWQRRLVDALVQVDTAKNLQFILASHSLEILTRHRDSVISLHEAGA